jgi:hypothetical protein
VTEGYYHEEPGEFLPYFGTPLDKLFGDLEGFCTVSLICSYSSSYVPWIF